MIALIIGIVVSLVITMIGTPTLIRVVHKLHYGQYIRQDGPQSHQVKRGTPTLGGVVIVLAVLLGWGASALYRYCSQHIVYPQKRVPWFRECDSQTTWRLRGHHGS